MTIKEICKLRTKIDDLVNAHPDELKKHLASAVQESGNIDGASEIQKQYDQIVVPGRLLHIGIVGRVKAGKSSLLNSLFFGGKNVLPKAATPMTAALTKLFYSEKPEVIINFIDQKDKDNIEQKAKEYETIFKTKVEKLLNDKRERAERRNEAFNEMEKRKECERIVRIDLEENNIILAGAAGQNKLLQKAPQDVLKLLGKQQKRNIDKPENIAQDLAEYVGANGKYTAITRDVELGFPFEQLKDIVVVDTPGFDDPVPSRDAAARTSLKKCDAIFILSPAGQFLNDQDCNNIEKIESGEGIQHIYIIASKIDSELGNESKDQSDGLIKKELELIVESISHSLKSIIGTFDYDAKLSRQFSEDLGKGVLYTSGMCQSMYETWDNHNSWDNDQNDTWERLQSNYPEYFSDKNNTAKETLKLIGNIQAIKDKLNEVRSLKDEILSKRVSDLLNAKSAMVKKLIISLKENFDEEVKTFENADIDELREEQTKLSEDLAGLQLDFEEALEVAFDSFIRNCEDGCERVLDKYYERTSNKINDTTGIDTVTRTVKKEENYDVTVKDDGLGGKLKRLLGIGGYHTETRTREVEYHYDENVNYMRAGEGRAAIKDFAEQFARHIRRVIADERANFRAELKSVALKVWAKYNVGEYYSGKNREIQAAKIVQIIPDTSISIDRVLPPSLESGVRLYGEEAEKFKDALTEETRNIKQEYMSSIDLYINSLRKSLNHKKAANDILKLMKNNLDDLVKRLQEKESTLDTYKRIESEISKFVKTIAE